jgi:hypothetical protein
MLARVAGRGSRVVSPGGSQQIRVEALQICKVR